MKSQIGVNMSEWGAFEIPDDMPIELYDCNKQSSLSKFLRLEHRPVWDIAPLPKNGKFWAWLKKQELIARGLY